MINSKINPGIAATQVMTKKRAHPTTGTSAPAAAPERFRGKVASADSNAY
jgi:hypothetical protein